MSRKDGGKGLVNIEDSVDASMERLEDYVKRTEEGWLQQPENIQTTQASTEENNLKTKMGRKTTVWTFQATNKRNLTWENLDIAKKEKA